MIPLLAGAAARLAPYGLWLKLGAAVLALGLAGWAGWRMAEAGNARETARLERSIAAKNEALRNAARTFRTISERTEALAKAAEVATRANEATAVQARRDYDALIDRLSGLDKVLEAAKRRGGRACAAQLEAELCVPLE